MKKLLVCFSLITFIVIILGGCSENNENSMIGIYLRSTSGSNIIINEDNGPIIMSNETGKENVFDNLKSGDKIKITYDSIRESYPALTEIYTCKLIEEGSENDIPRDILERLQEIGWQFELIS